jgi:hypothetical protein
VGDHGSHRRGLDRAGSHSQPDAALNAKMCMRTIVGG